MLIQKKPKLNLYKKLEILQLLLDNEPFVYSLDELNEQEIIEAQNFIWEKTLEFGIRIKRDDFSKEEILKDIKSNKEFHKEKQCKEPLSNVMDLIACIQIKHVLWKKLNCK